MVPLAPLGDVRPNELPAVIARMKERLDAQAKPGLREELWSAAYILMGMRYVQALIRTLLQGVVSMKESVTYQAILSEGEAKGLARGKAEGKAEEARHLLLLLGREQFGEPTADVQAAVDALADLNRLEELTVRLRHAATWHELLGLPAPRRPSSRKKRPS